MRALAPARRQVNASILQRTFLLQTARQRTVLPRMFRRRAVLRLWAIAVAMLAAAAFAPASAAELLMFELQGCPWCRRWHAEIGPAYPNTPAGQKAPLRIVDIRRPALGGITLAKPVQSSPTFVLVEDGREIGRITGYPGAEFFWPMLDDLLAKLDAPSPAPSQPMADGTQQRAL